MKDNLSATLCWNLEDYLRNGVEPPSRVISYPQKTEGEMMKDEEIQDWYIENIKTLKVINQDSSDTFIKIHEGFITDLIYLNQLGRLDEDAIIYAKDLKNYDF
ncbi:hypothetical protein HGB13_04265 [bacterium]|nr:hypothetical protein [bacterium]